MNGVGGGVNAKVKDLQTGRELSVKEFEDSLGLSPLMREVSLRERSMEQSREGEPQEPVLVGGCDDGGGGGASVGKAVASAVDKSTTKKTAAVSEATTAAASAAKIDADKKPRGGKKKPFGRNPGRWLTKRMGEAKAYLAGGDDDSPKRSNGPGYSDGQDDPAMRAIRAAAAAAGPVSYTHLTLPTILLV